MKNLTVFMGEWSSERGLPAVESTVQTREVLTGQTNEYKILTGPADKFSKRDKWAPWPLIYFEVGAYDMGTGERCNIYLEYRLKKENGKVRV